MKGDEARPPSRASSKRSTRLSSSGSDGKSDIREFQESIVRRTNELFVKLKITTRPIQAFEELQKSASSMFVAIFETLFNVRLKHVSRKPRLVKDYVDNANLVMTALSELVPIDLSFLSGEAIYHGDPMQIHHMLAIFESLWTQLIQSQETQRLTEGGAPGSEPDLNLSSESLRSSPPKLSPGDGLKSPSKQSSSRAKTPVPGLTASDLRSKGQKVRKGGARGKAGPRRGGARKPKTHAPKATAGGNKTLLHKRVQERKKKAQQGSGTSSLHSLPEAAQSRLDKENLKVLADQYPSVYRTVVAKSAYPKRALAAGQGGKRRVEAFGPTFGNAVAVRMEADLERYQKAYNLLVKNYDAHARRMAYENKRNVALNVRAKERDQRGQVARTALAEKLLSNKERSHALERQTKEEVLVRQLFSNTLKLEHSYALDQKKYERDEQRIVDEARLNRYESLKNYYLDREALLTEKMAEEVRDKKVMSHARRIAVRQLEKTLRNDFETKLEQMTNEWEQREARERLSTEQNLSHFFESFGSRLQAAPL